MAKLVSVLSACIFAPYAAMHSFAYLSERGISCIPMTRSCMPPRVIPAGQAGKRPESSCTPLRVLPTGQQTARGLESWLQQLHAVPVPDALKHLWAVAPASPAAVPRFKGQAQV